MDPFLAPPAKQSTAELAASTMWEYQLRRENRAILERIREIGERRDADVSRQIERMQEVDQRVDALTAQVKELEEQQKEKDARAAEHERKCTAKIAEMEKLLRSRMTDEEFNKMRSDAMDKILVRSNAELANSSAIRRPSTNQRSAAGAQHVITNNTPDPIAAPSRPEARPAKALKVANRRPATRSASSGGNKNPGPSQQIAPYGLPAPSHSTPSSDSSAPASFPKLAQKHRTLKQYYEQANSIFQSMTINDFPMEFAFVNAFIAGLEKKNSEKLLKVLEAVHPAVVQPHGIEIHCGWEDIPAGLKRAGLDLGGAREEIRRKKRTLNPRTQLETGFAN